ncbi:8-amino-7-oxononanoate synthase [Salix suchowensis]|nr:8-amino-7-oxononanoate synthase [Salix suchowensis]
MLQAQKVRLTDYLDERSAYLTQFAEKTKAEFDKIGEDARVRLGIGIANSFISSSPDKGKVVALGAIGGLINEQRVTSDIERVEKEQRQKSEVHIFPHYNEFIV